MKRLVVAAALAATTAQAQEPPAPPATPAPEPCQQRLGDGPPSATCFDPGHRLYLSGGTDGLGWGIQLRNLGRTDEPDTTWRSEHGLLRGSTTGSRYRGALYEGRFMRHSRQGYLLLPGSPPRRLSVPFDVGLETAVARVSGLNHDPLARVNVVRGALLADFSRSDSFRYRAAIGPVARWDIVADRTKKAATEQAIAPFTVGYASFYLESKNGLTLASLSGEAGYATIAASRLWRRQLAAEISFERVLVALNDRPLSLYALGRYEQPGDGLRAEVGVRLALFTRDRRPE